MQNAREALCFRAVAATDRNPCRSSESSGVLGLPHWPSARNARAKIAGQWCDGLAFRRLGSPEGVSVVLRFLAMFSRYQSCKVRRCRPPSPRVVA